MYPRTSNTLVEISNLENVVGGSIDLVTLKNYTKLTALENICLIVRDDGAKIPDPQPCLKIGRTILFGTIAAVGYTPDGDLRDLTAKEITAIDKFLILHSVTDRPFLTPTDLFGGSINNV